MFDFVRKHTRLLFFFLILLIIPSFVFLGLDGYSSFRDGANRAVAEVDGVPITQAELDAAHRNNVERVRREMPTIDAALLDSPALKQQSLESLIRERVLLAAVNDEHLFTSDARMLRLFRADPQFASLRNPDGSINKELLQAQGMSSEAFAQRLRQEISTAQVLNGIGATAIAPAVASGAALDAYFQQREIQVLRFDARELAKGLVPSDADLQAFHADPANAGRFQAPERADIEYVVLDLETISKGVKLSDDELRTYYDQNLARYSTAEERRASHILIKSEASAPAAERAKARAKAEQLLAELKAQPESFAEVARRESQDPGSAANGGDLDFFGRGAMVKAFEEAAFGLQPGAISGVVESDFGYHLIKLTAVRGGEKRSFETVRGEIEAEVRRELAQKKFVEAASEFGNLVYEQSDSLKPAADRFGLEIRREAGIERNPPAGATGPVASPKFRAALFGGEVVRNKRNTDAVETAPNQLIAARVTQHQPARALALDEVRDVVRQAVVAKQAAALARKNGEAQLQALKAAPATLAGPAQTISRAKTEGLPRKLVEAALGAPADPLPAFVGVDLGAEGYAVVRVARIVGRDPVAADPEQARSEYARAWGDAESRAYYNALKARYSVEIKDAALVSAAPAAASASGR